MESANVIAVDLGVPIAGIILIAPFLNGGGWGIANSMSGSDDSTLPLRLYMVEVIWITCHAATTLMNTGGAKEISSIIILGELSGRVRCDAERGRKTSKASQSEARRKSNK